MLAAPCPICGERVARGPNSPFCSVRCRTIDLGQWLGDRYVVAAHADDAPSEGDAGDGDRAGTDRGEHA